MWRAILDRIVSEWRNRPDRIVARVPECRCAGACKCSGPVPYRLYRRLESETEFYRAVR